MGPAALAPDQLDRVSPFNFTVPLKNQLFLSEVQQINQRHAGHLQHGINMQLQRPFPLWFKVATGSEQDNVQKPELGRVATRLD